MVIKNTAANRRLVNQLSDYLMDKTPYFRGSVNHSWNCSADIRFEIASVGERNPIIISTAYTPTGGFWFKVRLLWNQLDTVDDLIRMRFRLDDAETILLGMRPLIENAHPRLSEIE